MNAEQINAEFHAIWNNDRLGYKGKLVAIENATIRLYRQLEHYRQDLKPSFRYERNEGVSVLVTHTNGTSWMMWIEEFLAK